MRRIAWLRGAGLAKITLSLRVVGTRPDGYHDIEALTVSSNAPADFVYLNRRRRSGISIAVVPPGAAPSGPDNLVARAVESLWPDLSLRGGVRVRVHKEIPVGAGLGGGSSNAAAALRLLGHVGHVPEPRLLELAAQLGSDVPFCLRGSPAWMRGRGELLEPISSLPPLMLVIAVPPFACSTPAVYRAWDELGGPRSAREVPAPESFAHLVPAFVNDLEPAAEQVEPQLQAFRERFEAAVECPPLLCGSGSAYAAWFDDPEAWRAGLDAARRTLPSASVFGGSTI
ncbi:MAG: 4-diphosphocytidyl-2-C-methyl-D-erythritol kinase [Actinomycetia bacterium]|nr:4-diphosphocytidyl-2-C-methyl-D-erythritol kinase [Actinomycetes bacterium]